MKRFMRVAGRCLFLVSLVVGGCSSGATTSADGPADRPGDSGRDGAPTDTKDDAPADAPVDAAPDAPVDAAPDAPVDAPADTPVDAPADAPVDVTVDAVGDTIVDAMGDVTPDEPVRAAALSVTPPAGGFGDVEVGVVSGALTWIVTNTGGAESGAITLVNGAPTEVAVTNGCPATLAPGASCQIAITFKPTAVGPRTASVVVSADPGGAVELLATARGRYRLTVVPAGTGTVTSTPAGITCGTSCSMLVGEEVATLRAATTNGSGFFFSGWSGGGCAGPAVTCSVDVRASVTVSATFSPMTTNLVFMTRSSFATNLGSAVAYDAHCNAAATAAGINDAAGGAYIAFISDSASLAQTRLGTARGWLRMDAKVFADTRDSLLAPDAKIFNSITFDEAGGRLAGAYALTGAGPDGSNSLDCDNWTTRTNASSAMYGNSDRGPETWLSGVSDWCSNDARLICMGRARNAVASPAVTAGKRIWQSNTFLVMGGQSPDAKCQAERPPGVSAGVALLSTTSKAAAAALTPAAVYVRPDGTRVGTGAEIAAGQWLESGVWQTAAGTYQPPVVWTGSTGPALAGTTATTCANWTDPSATANGRGGESGSDQPSWWSSWTVTCDQQHPIYCVEP